MLISAPPSLYSSYGILKISKTPDTITIASTRGLHSTNPVFTYQFKRSNVVEKNSEDLLSQAEQMIKDMQRCLL